MEPERAPQHTTDVEAPAPAVERPAPGTGFWRGASNHAVASLLTRSVSASPGLARTADRAGMQAIETAMVAVKTSSRSRATEFNRLSDQSLGDLRAAESHLRQSNTNYETAYSAFTGKLGEADERFAAEQAVKDAVQGILVAAALAVVGPELLIVKGGTALVEATATTTAAALARAGASGGLGEVAEMGGGAVAGGVRGEAVRPGSTVAGGGPTSGDKFKEAFGKLSELIQAMPALGRAATLSMNIALFAGEIETEAVRLGGGGTGRWTEAELGEKSQVARTADTDEARSLEPARNAAARVRVLKEQITSAPIKTPDEIERLIWTNWMATLSGDANEVLDNDVIQRYLVGKGLMPDVTYLTDGDQADAVTNARKDVLRQRGIDVGPGVQIDSIYRREMKLDELKRLLLGKRGRITGRDQVSAENRVFDAPGQFGGAEVGAEVTITHLIVKPHMQGLTMNIAEWGDRDFDVMGVAVAAQEAAQPRTELPPPTTAPVPVP